MPALERTSLYGSDLIWLVEGAGAHDVGQIRRAEGRASGNESQTLEHVGLPLSVGTHEEIHARVKGIAGRGEVAKGLDREGFDLHVSPRTPSDAHRHHDVEVALQSRDRLRRTSLALGALVLHEEVDLLRLARLEKLLEVS